MTIRILHISDLHLSPARTWDSDDVLAGATAIISSLPEKNLTPNFVAITGDLASKGLADEYEVVEKWLLETFEAGHLQIARENLLFVPGNHDVDRGQVKTSTIGLQNHLLTSGNQDAIAKVLSDAEEAELLMRRHEQYRDFVKRVNPQCLDGENPWWSQKRLIGGTTVHIAGMCSSWMSHDSNTDKGNLLVGKYQLSQTMDIKDQPDIAIALVHHPLEYLHDCDAEDFETHLRLRYDLVLRGHLHTQRLRGLTTPDGAFHDIAAGSLYAGSKYQNSFQLIEIEPENNTLSLLTWIWRDGRWIQDKSAYENSKEGIVTVPLRPVETILAEVDTPKLAVPKFDWLAETTSDFESMLADAVQSGDVRQHLANLPPFRYERDGRFQFTREAEQAECESILRKDRVLVLVADWGLGKSGFLGAVLERLWPGEVSSYCLQCDEIRAVEELLEASKDQFGMHLQEFCRWVGGLEKAVLVLEDVRDLLFADAGREGLIGFEPLMSLILEYCPRLRVVITCRSEPEFFRPITLRPLDQVDTQQYLSKHSAHRLDVSRVDLDRVYERTGGLPKNLDQLVDAVKLMSLDDALDALALPSPADEKEPVPNALKNAVAKLQKDSDEVSRRSMRLLRALTVLESGESLKTIKKLYSAAPFWLSHAQRLLDLSLLEVVSTTDGYVASIGASNSVAPKEAEKILRVPRAVRDYTKTLLPADEIHEVITAATELLFGRNWWKDRIRLVKRSNGGATGIGNEHIVVRYLLRDAFEKEDTEGIVRAARLGLEYCRKLEANDRYREGYIAAKELLTIVNDSPTSALAEELIELQRVCGDCGRMIREYEEAIELLTNASAANDAATNKDREISLQLTLALIFDSLGDKPSAIGASKRIRELAHSDSDDYLQATAILYSCEKNGDDLSKSLKRLETQARNRGYLVVANNIAIDRANLTSDPKDQLDHLSRVLRAGSDDYNKIRAYASRVRKLVRTGKANEVSEIDRRWIVRGYSYAYKERMESLFNSCHDASWELCKAEGNTTALLKIFRHSSFIWRLHGEASREQQCVTELRMEFAPIQMLVSALMKEALYFDDRMRALDVTENALGTKSD